MKLRGNSDGEPEPLRPITGITPGNSTARNQGNSFWPTYWIQPQGQVEGEGQPQGVWKAQKALGKELRT